MFVSICAAGFSGGNLGGAEGRPPPSPPTFMKNDEFPENFDLKEG
jgi:hypothetical protein